jgi:hypothetical protein
MKWAGLVVRVGEVRSAQNILVRKPERKSHSVDLGLHGRITLERIFDGRV